MDQPDLKQESRPFLLRVFKPTAAHRSRAHTLRGTTMSPREWFDVPAQVARRLSGKELDEPWLSRSAIRKLRTIAKPTSSVLELGSGGSTIWLARRTADVLSFEVNPAWTEKTRSRLARAGVENARVESVTFDSIEESLRALEDERFDLVIVDVGDDLGDGPGRVDLVDVVRSKVKRGGHLILDNSDRPAYAPADDLLAGWEITRAVGPTVTPLTVIETTFYRRPI